jgi:hypothetical protein
VVLWILRVDLKKQKLCSRFVPHALTWEQMDEWVAKCQDLLTFSVRHLNAIRSTANRGCSGIKPLPALQRMQLSSCKG